MRKQKYSTRRFKALRDKGYSYFKIAKITGAHPSTVMRHLIPRVKQKMNATTRKWQKAHKKQLSARFKYKYDHNAKFRREHLDYCKKRQKARGEELKKLRKLQYRLGRKRRKIKLYKGG